MASCAQISIHALCEEGDAASPRTTSPRSYFYPRPLRGGRRERVPRKQAAVNFYPRPLRGGRLCHIGASLHVDRISIHALCEEGDQLTKEGVITAVKISIHALCEEGDECLLRASQAFAFLSTPSARRATLRSLHPVHCPHDFYPRPLRGGRPLLLTRFIRPKYFYPRPLRGGRPKARPRRQMV